MANNKNTGAEYKVISKLNAADMKREIPDFKDMELTINEVVSQVFFKENGYKNLEGIINTLEVVNKKLEKDPTAKTNVDIRNIKEVKDNLVALKNNIAGQLGINENASQEQLALAQSILGEFGQAMNFALEDKFNADNIGRKLMQGSSSTVSDLKGRIKQFVLANKERYGNTQEAVNKTLAKIIKEVSGINASDVDVNPETGLADINKILLNNATHKKAFSIDEKTRATPAKTRDTNISKIRELGAEKARATLDGIVGVAKSRYVGGQDPVQAFYEGISDGYKKALDGSYLVNRTKGMRGDSTTLQQNGAGFRIKDSLSRISNVLKDNGYSMHLRLNEKTGQMTVGYNKSSNQKIYDKEGNVDFSKLTGSFNIGLDDGSGLIRKSSGQKAVNMLSAEYRKFGGKDSTFLSSASDLAAEDIAKIFERNVSLLRDNKAEELTRKINAQIRNRENLTATPNPYKTSGVHDDTRSMGSGVSSPGLLAIRTHAFSAQNLFKQLIKDHKLTKPTMNSGSAEQNERAVMNDLYALTAMYGSGATQEEIDDYIYANKDLQYLTKHRASGLILDKLKPFANLGINNSAIKQGAASDAIMGTIGSEVYDPILALGKESYRGYAQTDMALSRQSVKNKSKSRKKPKNWSESVVRSKLGEELGVYDTRDTDNLQDIAYVTEEQIKAGYEKLFNEKVNVTKSMSSEQFYAKYGQAPSVTYDSILYNRYAASNLDGYSDMGVRTLKLRDVNSAWKKARGNKSKARYYMKKKMGLRQDKKSGMSYTYERVGDDEEGNPQYHVYKRQNMTNGAKIGVGDGTRATAQLTHSELMNAILSEAGYNTKQQIDAVKVAEAPNSRNLAGFVSSRMNYVLKTLRDQDGGTFGQSRQSITDMFKTAGLNFSFSDDGKRLSVEDPTEKWRGMSDDDRAQMFRNLLLGTEGLADRFGGRAYNDDGNGGLILSNPNKLITSSSINQLDIMHWEKAVGNLDEDKLGQSKHTVGDRERSAVARSIKLAANGKDFSLLNNYLQDAMANSESDKALYEQRLEDHGRAIAMTGHSLEIDNGQDDRYTVKIGKGEGVEDISRLLNKVNFDDGAITDIDKEQDFFRQVERLRQERAEQLAKEDGISEAEAFKKVRAKLMFGTDSNGNAVISSFGNTFDGGETSLVAADGLFLPNRGLDSIGEGRYVRPGYAKEVLGLARTIEDGAEYKEGATPWLDDNFRYAYKSIVNDVDNKNGQTYKKTHKTKMQRSMVGQQNSINAMEALEGLKGVLDAKVSEDIANTAVQFSSGDVAKMLSYNGEKDILNPDKMTSLEDQRQYDAYLNRLKMVYDDIYEGKSYLGKPIGPNAKAEDLRTAIMDSITIGNRNFQIDEQTGRAKGLSAIMHRFPSTNGLDEKFVRAVINPLLQDGTMVAGLGLGRSMNADSDGDKLYAFLSQFYGKDMSQKNFKQLMSQMRTVQERDRKTSSLVGKYEGTDTISKQGDMNISSDILRGASDRESGIIGGILSKTNFLKTGVFSNLASGMRGLLSNSNVDELAMSSDYNSQEQAAKAMITRALFESMEQDAISSKKVEQRILKNKGKESGTVEEKKAAAAQALTELESVINRFYNNTDGYASDPNKLISDLTNIGIIGNEGLEGRVVAQAIGNISQMSHGKEIAKNLGIKYAEFDKDGNLQINEQTESIKDYGKISTSVLTDSLHWANKAGTKYGNNGLKRMVWHENTPGSRDADKNTAYSASKTFEGIVPEGTLTNLDKLDSKYVNIASSVAKVNEQLALLKGNLQGDITLEQSKIGVATEEAEARNNVADSANKQAGAVDNANKAEKLKTNVAFGRITNKSGDNFGVRRSIKEVLEPTTGMYDTNLSELTTTLRDARERTDINWSNLSDEERVSQLIDGNGPNALKHFNAFKSVDQSTAIGTIAHKTAEVISLARQEGLGEISSIADIENYITNLKASGTNGDTIERLEGYLSSRNKAIDEFKQNSVILGRSGNEVNSIIDIATGKGQNAYNALQSYVRNRTSGNYTTMTPEAEMSINVNGRSIRGQTDFMAVGENEYGAKTAYIGDYKHTGDINAESILQQLVYKRIIQEAQAKGSTAQDVIGKIKQSGLTVSNVKLQEQEIDQLLEAKNIENIIAHTDNEGGTTIKTIRSNAFTEGLVDKVLRGEVVTAEEQEALKGVVQASPIAQSKDEALAQKQKTLAETQKGSEFYAKMIQDQKELSNLYKQKLDDEKKLLGYIQRGIVSSEERRKIEEQIKQTDEAILAKKKEYEASGDDSRKTAQTKGKFREFAESAEKSHDKDYKKAFGDVLLKPGSRAEATKAVSQLLGKHKKEYSLQQQIANTERSMKEMKSGDPMYGSAKESIASMQQALALLREQKIELNEQGQIVIGKGTEQEKIVQLTAQELNNYRAQMTLLNQQHKTKMANIGGPKQTWISTMFGNFKRQISYMTTQSMVYRVIGTITQTFQQLINTIKQLDKAMVDLQIASGYSRDQMNGALKGYNQIASEMGRTTTDVLSAANDWLRAGYDIETANNLIRESMKLSTLGMMESADATKALISASKGWKLTAEEVGQVTDELTKLDMAAATSAGDLATAMAKANATASLAGADRHSYEAYLTTVLDVSQQSPETAGTAFKTLFARYSNIKAGKYASEYDSEDDDGEFEALNDVETVLAKSGIKIRDSVSEFRDVSDVIADIAAKWKTMEGVEKNAVAAALGGTRQREQVSILFENWDKVEKYKEIAENADGTSDTKMVNYTQGIEAAQNRLTAAIEKYTTGKGFENAVTGIYNLLTQLVKSIDKIAVAVAAYLAVTKGNAIVNGISGFGDSMNKIASAPGRALRSKWESWHEDRDRWKREYGSVSYGRFAESYDATRARQLNDLDKTMSVTADRMKSNRVAVDGNIITDEQYTNARALLSSGNLDYKGMSARGSVNGETFKSAAALMDEKFDGIDENAFNNFKKTTLDADNKVAQAQATSDFYKDSDMKGAQQNYIAALNEEAQAAREAAATKDQVTQQERELLQALGLDETATAEERQAKLDAALRIRNEAKNQGLNSGDVKAAGRLASDGNVKGAFRNILDQRDGSSMSVLKDIMNVTGTNSSREAKKIAQGAANIMDKVAGSDVESAFKAIDFGDKDKLKSLKDNLAAIKKQDELLNKTRQDRNKAKSGFSAAAKENQKRKMDAQEALGDLEQQRDAAEQEWWDTKKTPGTSQKRLKARKEKGGSYVRLSKGRELARIKEKNQFESAIDSENDKITGLTSDRQKMSSQHEQQLEMLRQQEITAQTNKNMAIQQVEAYLKDQGIDISQMSEKEKHAYLEKIQAILNGADAENKAAQAALKGGLKSEQLRGAGKNPNGGLGTWIKRNEGAVSGISNMVGMASSMVAMQHMSGTGMSDEAQSWTSMGISMAPMIGGMIGSVIPGIGTAAGTAIGAIVSVAGAAIVAWKDAATVTKEESEKIKQEISQGVNKIQEKIDAIETIEENRGRLQELAKGVDWSTGINISLSDSEYGEYVSLLEDISEKVQGIYTVTDENGNTTLKLNGSIVDLTTAVNELKSQAQSEAYITAREVLNEPKINSKRADVIRGQSNVEKTHDVEIDWQDKRNSAWKHLQNIGINQTAFGTWVVNTNTDGRYDKIYENSEEGIKQFKEALWEYIKYAKDNETDGAAKKQASNLWGKHTKQQSNDLDTIIATYLNPQQAKSAQGEHMIADANSRTMQEYSLTNMQGTVGGQWFKLSDRQQKAMHNMFGNLGMLGVDHLDEAKDQWVVLHAQQAMVEWAANNQDKMKFIENYNAETASSDDTNLYKQYIDEMIGAGNLYIANDNVRSKWRNSIYTSVGFVNSKDGWISNKQKKYNEINKIDGFSKLKIKIDDLSDSEIGQIYDNKGVIGGHILDGKISSLQDLRDVLTELNLQSSKSTASHYLHTIKSQMDSLGLSANDTASIVKALKDENGELYNTFAAKQLLKVASALNIEIDQLIDNIEILGTIDAFGRTSKTLEEVTEQFSKIDTAIQDINDNGKISVDNLQALIDEFPELVKYVGSSDDNRELLSKLNELSGFKGAAQAASIKNTPDTSDIKFKLLIDELDVNAGGVNPEYSSKVYKDNLMMFGNFKTMQEAFYNMFDVDEDTDTVKIKSRYENMDIWANGNTQKDSWEKYIAQNVFGMEQLEEGWEQNLYKMMRAELKEIDPDREANISAYGSGGQAELLGIYRNMMIGNSSAMYAQQMFMDAETQIASYKQVLALEDEMREQEMSNYLSRLDSAWGRGTLSLDEYRKRLESVTKEMGASNEQLQETKEKLEELKFDEISKQFERGALSASKFREELRGLMKDNDVDSEDWQSFVDSYISSYQQEIDNLDKEFEFLEDDDYSKQKDAVLQKQDLLGQKLAATEAAGRAKYGDAYNKDEDPAYLAVKKELMDSFNQLSDILGKQYDKLKSNYDNGYIGIEEYIVSLKELVSNTDASAEQLKQWNEELEDSIVKLKKLEFDEGRATGDDYRAALANKMHNNDETSDDYIQARTEYLGSYDTEIQKEQSNRSLLDEHDYVGHQASVQRQIEISAQKYAAYVAAGMENSKEAVDALKQQVDLQKESLDLKKQEYEYEIQKSSEVLDAYNNILSYGMDELQNRQQDINDMYDEEISKLQDINDQKQRSIELTKLQQELENAKKEKTRVYQAGIGWTYQENKARVKQAKQNLENYLDERKISDLQNAQKQQNALIQDQIDRLSDIQKYINDIKMLSSTTASLMDLKKNGIVPQDATISDAINQITKEAVNGEDSKVTALGTSFEGYKESYLLYNEKLSEFEDNYPALLENLAGWASTYTSDEALVAKLKEDFKSNVQPIEDKTLSIEEKLSNFLGGKTYDEWTKDLNDKFISSANNIVGAIDGIKNKDLSEIKAKMDEAYDQRAKAIKLMELLGSSSFTSSTGTWTRTADNLKPGQQVGTYSNKYLTKKTLTHTDGSKVEFYEFDNTETDYIGGLFTLTYGAKDSTVKQGTEYWTMDYLSEQGWSGFSDGIENGPVTYTGLAMLHGSPSSPEYVLNSEQAGTLLKNLATMTMSPYQAPKIDSYNHSASSTVYQFNGDLHLPNVQRPDQFFSELLKQANTQFPTIKKNYI